MITIYLLPIVNNEYKGYYKKFSQSYTSPEFIKYEEKSNDSINLSNRYICERYIDTFIKYHSKFNLKCLKIAYEAFTIKDDKFIYSVALFDSDHHLFKRNLNKVLLDPNTYFDMNLPSITNLNYFLNTLICIFN